MKFGCLHQFGMLLGREIKPLGVMTGTAMDVWRMCDILT
jgi:hypothetical protein